MSRGSVSARSPSAAHHSTRALTPRHPRHRVVTAEYAAVLYPPDEGRWAGRVPRPYRAGSWAPGDACGEAAEALAAAGLEVHTWVVLAHNSRLGAEHPGTCVVNAYGDRYPWASCIAQPAVRAFLTGPAAGAAGPVRNARHRAGVLRLVRPRPSARPRQDRRGGTRDAAQYAMSLCFCRERAAIGGALAPHRGDRPGTGAGPRAFGGGRPRGPEVRRTPLRPVPCSAAPASGTLRRPPRSSRVTPWSSNVAKT